MAEGWDVRCEQRKFGRFHVCPWTAVVGMMGHFLYRTTLEAQNGHVLTGKLRLWTAIMGVSSAPCVTRLAGRRVVKACY